MRKIYFLQNLSHGTVYQFDLSVFLESSHYETMYHALFRRNSQCHSSSELYDLLCVLLHLVSGETCKSKVVCDNIKFFKQLYGCSNLRSLVKEIKSNFKYLTSTKNYYNLNPHVYGVNR